jgi:cytochrome c oxidase accessory protein FixG
VLHSELWSWTLGPWEAFWILFYGFATYGNAGWMREQVCKYMCPYARFQSAMFDRDTLIVTYDAERGEGRGPRPRSDTPQQYKAKGLGDCIGCDLCVQVCPTGIDIRKGLQYECISCSACIDVCNTVMKKMHYPKGLIRYSTQNAMTQKLSDGAIWKRVLRPRILVYSAILLVVMTTMLWSLVARTPLKVDVVRDRGTLSRTVGQGLVENVYRLQIMNATESAQVYDVKVSGIDGAHALFNAPILVEAVGSKWLAVRVQVPAFASAGGSYPILFEVISTTDSRIRVVEKANFLMPR